MKKTFCFSINTQFENLGDALINNQLLRKCCENGQLIVDASRCPKSFCETLELEKFPSIILFGSFLKFYLHVIFLSLRGENVFYFLNPGGLGKPNSWKKKIGAFIYSLLLLNLRLFGVKICHIGMSYSPMTPTDRAITKLRYKACYKVYPRDNSSLSYLQRYRLKADGVIPDLAFFLPVKTTTNNDKTILFSFRVDESAGLRDLYLRFIEQVIVKFGDYNVIFLSQVRRDNEFMKEAYEYFNAHFPNVKFEYVSCIDNIQSNLGVYRRCSHAFSNRLHVLMMAWSAGCRPSPCLRDGEGTKIRALFGDAGLSNIVIDLNSTTIKLDNDFDSYQNIFQKQQELAESKFKELINHVD